MTKDTLISVEDLSKKFCRSLKHSLWYGIQDISHELVKSSDQNLILRDEEFWVLENISFELRRGECLGLIGANGAGKSTLLKILNGLIKPDVGKITIWGNVGALIELGSGINPILTGRENIYINGAVLGLGKKEVDEKLDSIIEFAELKDSIDAPVKNYSTGMKVRLGFAIAAQIKPDILIIDEVLSVGDVGFQAKCFNHICDLLDSTAIILVSHSMQQISRLCTHSLHLHSGKIKYLGDDVGASVASYYKHSHLNQSIFEFGEGQAEIHRVDIESDQTLNPSVINSGESLKIHVTFSADSDIKNLSIGFVFSSEGLVGVLSCLSNLDGFQIQNNGKQMTITANLGAIRLNPGTYWLRVGILADNFGKILVRKDNIKSFIVKGPIVQWAPVQWRADWKINPT